MAKKVELSEKDYDKLVSAYMDWQVGKPKKVIFNNPATIIIWKDGTKSVAKCSQEDSYDKMKGFLVAYYKKKADISNTEFSKLFDVFKDSYIVEF